jgi:tripartite-type tricarboxylate transporter receptor subunit TctC
MSIKKHLAILAAAISCVASIGLSTQASAQAYPNKPVQVVIPFAPGDTDKMLRPFLDRMGEFLPNQFILNYKPGAGGAVGAGFVAGSAPDGYTLVGTSPGSIVVVPLANKDVKYSTESFEPIAALSEGGFMIVGLSKSPLTSLKELVAYSKQHPDKVTYGTSGAMGITHLLAEIFASEAGVKWNHIPFQGSGPAITALLGGHVELASTAVGPAQAHIAAGTLRPLAVFGDTRLKAFPNVPTLKELGYKTSSAGLYGILAPKGTPKEIIDAIYGAAQKAIAKYGTQITANLDVLGAEIKVLGPKEYAKFLEEQKVLFAQGLKTIK